MNKSQILAILGTIILVAGFLGYRMYESHEAQVPATTQSQPATQQQQSGATPAPQQQSYDPYSNFSAPQGSN